MSDDPLPAPGTPPPPSWLDDMAKAEWERVVPGLSAIGLLSEVDQASLGAYCQAVSDYVAAVHSIRDTGKVFRTPQGYLAKNPMVTILNESRRALLQFAGHFGLTPTARANLSIERKSDPDENRGKGKFFGKAK